MDIEVQGNQKETENDQGIHDSPFEGFENIRKQKLSLLESLPPAKYSNSDTDLLKQLKIYLDLSKKQTPAGEYLISSLNQSIKNKKEYSNPEEALQKFYGVFSIEEYGSNFPKEVFDPKELGQDPSDFYDAISRKQTEIQQGLKKVPSLNQSLSSGSLLNDSKPKKSGWDQTIDPVGKFEYPFGVQMPGIMGGLNPRLPGFPLTNLDLIAAQNKAFVGKK